MKELSKFLAGAFTYDSVSHIAMAIGGSLPFKLFGFEISKTINVVMIFVSAFLALLFIYYGWWYNKSKVS